MSDDEQLAAVGKAIAEATEEACRMQFSVLQVLLKKALDCPILDTQKPLVAAAQLVAVLMVLDHHLNNIGPQNFAETMAQVQKFMNPGPVDRGGRSPGLMRLSALLHPMQAFSKGLPKS